MAMAEVRGIFACLWIAPLKPHVVGGPLIPMIEKITRMKKLNGLPADVQMGDPHKFYEDLEKTSNGLQNWKGELVRRNI